jgi:two-component system OmpR family response regulator
MSAKMRILLVKSDPAAQALAAEFAQHSVLTDCVGTWADAGEAIRTLPYDAVVAAVEERTRGIGELCRRIKREPLAPPVIALVPGTDATARIEALRAGADDCLAEPFETVELVARLRALARRRPDPVETALAVGNLRFEPGTRYVWVGDKVSPLTRCEAALLEALLVCAGKTVDRGSLHARSLSDKARGDTNTLDVHIHRLRRRLSAAGANTEIQTAHGVGYVLVPPA